MINLLEQEFETLDTWGISSDVKKRFDKLINNNPNETDRKEAFRKAVIESLKEGQASSE